MSEFLESKAANELVYFETISIRKSCTNTISSSFWLKYTFSKLVTFSNSFILDVPLFRPHDSQQSWTRSETYSLLQEDRAKIFFSHFEKSYIELGISEQSLNAHSQFPLLCRLACHQFDLSKTLTQTSGWCSSIQTTRLTAILNKIRILSRSTKYTLGQLPVKKYAKN
jgi:hypothetical protein